MNNGAFKMRSSFANKTLKIFLIIILFLSLLNVNGRFLRGKNELSLRSLLPEIESWKFSEAPQNYLSETLYEYINGAAEIYLGYDFKELIVGLYKKADTEASVSIEIYDMRNEKNSFGIYSAERFPDNRFIPVGLQGYLEEGALNFIVGNYYIKLLCFDCEDGSESFLRFFSQEILKRIKEKGQFPPLLQVFPREGLIPNSEKFILFNFMGYEFLNNGYLANYKKGELEFECFIIEGKNSEETRNMLARYLAARNKESIQKISFGYRLKDRYYHNIYLARIEDYLCGVIKIKDGFEEVGEEYLKALVKSLK